MRKTDWRERMLDSTRGRVLALLRRTERTVGDVARELGLTDNAVRLHLSALERDGLVEASGTRQEWTGKPAVLYRTTADAEGLFPKPYGAVLSALLAELAGGHDRAAVERLLRRAGARLGSSAAARPVSSAGAGPDSSAGARADSFAGARDPDLSQRVRHAAEVLTALGGLAEVVVEGDGFRIQGFSCALADLVADHPGTCQLAESLVSEVVGRPVTECCERGERPRCAFRIAAA